MSISDLRILARLIHPKNIISLTLSNEQQTVHQIQYFLHDFRIDQFSQLRSLTLIGIHDDNLDQFQKYIMESSLKTLSISFGSCSLQSVDKLLLAISSCKLKNLIMLGVCRWDLAYGIVKQLVDDSIIMPNIIQYNNLTSLSLDVLYGIEMDYVESILILCHGLQYLRVFGSTYGTDLSLCDGYRWEHLIATRLPLLKQFEFSFTYCIRENQASPTIKMLIEPFRTPFWRDIKQWFVECDCKSNTENREFHLYSIPIVRDEFDYAHEQDRIFKSTLKIIDNNKPIIYYTHQLTLCLDRMMTENIQDKSNVTAKHLFRNVTDLTLIINQQWPIDSIKYLSTIVNLSNLDKICLNFQCKCDFVRSLDAEMKALFKRAWSLRSLQIMCRNPTAILWITGSAIGLKLPHHIKEFDIEVRQLRHTKLILERNKHLSRVTFRTNYCNGEKLADEIMKWLSDIGRSYVCKSDWGFVVGCECCDSVDAVCLWLDKRKQNPDMLSGHSSNPVSLYVSGFAGKCRYEDLQEIFGRYGRIVDISVPFDHHKRDFKEFAFVEYEKSRDAEAALDALDCCRLFGREITVKFAWSNRKTSSEMIIRKKETRYRRGDCEDGTGRHNRSRSRSRHRRSTSSETSDRCADNRSHSPYSHLPISQRRSNHSRSKYGSPNYGKRNAYRH
ncbi:unnamed protein product [Adineta steineri]|uniref:RRM domain-containing protein n=1 Tax=Adineta steineri TaxID=433720 RepID=A0A819VX11_9BILA|nr:unnamed protein product [Adineta steineri]CAF4114198.1 unnamed protein product [Adineta steineri]